MLSGADGDLPDREAALARFAVTLTARPWALNHGAADELTAQGYAPDGVEAATAIVAMFNYLTRVADASGIEFDYDSPLPAFRPQRQRQPAQRSPRATWPVVTGEFRTFPRFPALTEAWRQWRAYVLDSESPLSRRERRVLARAAAEECCDRWQAEQFDWYAPGSSAEATLDAFARRLSRQPWRMRPDDLDELRSAGYQEQAVLHAISVVAHQNAASRVALGRALVVR